VNRDIERKDGERTRRGGGEQNVAIQYIQTITEWIILYSGFGRLFFGCNLVKKVCCSFSC